MAEIKIIFDGARMEELMHGPDGMVSRFMIGRSEIVKIAGKAQCAQNGHLSEYILKRPIEEAGGLSVIIGCYHPAAIFVHEGTKPHKITGNPILAFKWPAVGDGMFFFRSVNHPGNAANKFLSDNLRLFFAY
jgi:hypothetical protein